MLRTAAFFPAALVAAGTVYRLSIGSIDNSTGSIALALSLSAPAPGRPTNDNFSAATALTGATAVTTTHNTTAEAEPGEHAPGDTPAAKSVWYQWSAPAAGRDVVSLIGSDFHTLLSIYTVTALNALTVIVRDDDSGPNATGEASFAATAGTTFSLAVDGYDSDSGDRKLNFALTADATGPANDHFAAATLLTGSAANAARETGEPARAAFPACREFGPPRHTVRP